MEDTESREKPLIMVSQPRKNNNNTILSISPLLFIKRLPLRCGISI